MIPLTYAGTVENRVESLKTNDLPHQLTEQVNVTVNGNGHIWQPWFLKLDGNATISKKYQWSDEQKATSSNINANVNFHMLPYSNFPTSLNLFHADGRMITDAPGRSLNSGVIQDSIGLRTRVGITQSMWVSGGIRLHNENMLGVGESNGLDSTLSISKNFDQSSITFTGRLSHDDFHEIANPSTPFKGVLGRNQKNAILSYDWGRDAFTLSNSLQLVDDREERDDMFFDIRERTATTNVSWTPDEKPYTFSSYNRAQQRQTTRDITLENALDSKWQELHLNSSNVLNYTLSSNLRFNTGFDFKLERFKDLQGGGLDVVNRGPLNPDDIFGEDPFDHSVDPFEPDGLEGNYEEVKCFTGLQYQGPEKKIRGFNWQWNGSGTGFMEKHSVSGFGHRWDVALGQTVRRSATLPLLGKGEVNLGQNVSTIYSSKNGSLTYLSHRIGFGSVEGGVEKSGSMDIWLSDRRQVTGLNKQNIQTLTFQISRNRSPIADSEWYGRIGGQVMRRQSENSKTAYFVSVNGTMGYRRRSPFQIINLFFQSELRLQEVGFEKVLQREEREKGRGNHRIRSEWQNTLLYRLGLLEAALNASVFYENSQWGEAVMLTIRRHFAGKYVN